jgi:hypothetical protein
MDIANAAGVASIRITCDLANVWIHECSLHSILWNSNPNLTSKSPSVSLARTRMLQRSLDVSKTYLRNLISVPSPTIHHVTFQVYTGWFYSTIVLVKLMFLHPNDISDGPTTANDDMPPEVSDLLARQSDDYASQGVNNMTASMSATTLHDTVTATGKDIMQLFQSFIEMARAAAPEAGHNTETGSLADNSVLWRVSMWQQGVLAGLKKRMESYVPVSVPSTMSLHSMATTSQQSECPRYTSHAFLVDPRTYTQPTQSMEYGEPVNYGYYDNGVMPAYPQVQQASIDPWMWDLVMEDVNMFNM